MSNDACQTILNLVQRLSNDEQFQLLEDLVAVLREERQSQPDVLELKESSTGMYRVVFSQVRQLPTDKKFRVLEDLAIMIPKGITRKPKHKITEFEGLGKEIWEGVDVEEYIRESRGSWETKNEEPQIDNILEDLLKYKELSKFLKHSDVSYEEQAKRARRAVVVYEKLARSFEAMSDSGEINNEESQIRNIVEEYIRQEKDS